jgi:hypothetical protein
MIVYPFKRISRDVAESVPPIFAIRRSDSGWMIRSIYEYITNVFYPSIIRSNVKLPVLFLLDGHKSHINMELYNFCVAHKILIMCLLPNATHIVQPCDVTIFRPLKVAWRKQIIKYKQQTTRPVTKANFAPLFQAAYTDITEKTIKNGFKTCGLYPFDPDAVDYMHRAC